MKDELHGCKKCVPKLRKNLVLLTIKLFLKNQKYHTIFKKNLLQKIINFTRRT